MTEAATRIVVEPSDVILRNVGDCSMLVAALERLRDQFPDARIQVITADAATLRYYVPGVELLPERGRALWSAKSLLVEDLPGLPRSMSSLAQRLSRTLRRRTPWLVCAVLMLREKLRGRSGDDLTGYLRAVSGADLLVVTGGGHLADPFADYSFSFLETVRLALVNDVPVVLMGQGIGPVSDERLLAAMTAVLPQVDLIALREDRAGLPLLRSIGVPAERIVTTGDDAIPLAHERVPAAIGSALGVNVRAADYAAIDRVSARDITATAKAAAARYAAEVVAIPITSYEVDSDFVTLAEVLGSDSIPDPRHYTVWDAIERVTRCRVVVAGSYHAAVFALSCGIPVVAVAGSAYYFDKFQGLAAQFGVGCHVEDVNGSRFAESLDRSIDLAWQEADHVRSCLLEAAERQIAIGRSAYARLPDIVRAHR